MFYIDYYKFSVNYSLPTVKSDPRMFVEDSINNRKCKSYLFPDVFCAYTIYMTYPISLVRACLRMY